MTSRKLQIFRFVLIEMCSPCFFNSRVMCFLVRFDCGPVAFLRSTSPSSLQSPTLFLPNFSLRLFGRKRPISSDFRSVEAAHSYVEHVAVVFLGPGGLVVK